MPSELPNDSATPRANEIYNAVGSLLHTYVLPNEDEGYGSPEVHSNLHISFATGFLSALEYMIEYPEQAARLITEYRKGIPEGEKQVTTDEAMGILTEKLFPNLPTVDVAERLITLARSYSTKRDVLFVTPNIDNGRVSWDNSNGEPPFPTWDESLDGYILGA